MADKSTRHNWTLPNGISPFLSIEEQTAAPVACLWMTERRHGGTVYLSVGDAAWLGQALLDFAAAARADSAQSNGALAAKCAECGRPCEGRHDNGRCADCY